jgi:hypothetical protein
MCKLGLILYVNMADFGKVTRAISQYWRHCLGNSSQGLLNADDCEQFNEGLLLRLNICYTWIRVLWSTQNKYQKTQLYKMFHYPKIF